MLLRVYRLTDKLGLVTLKLSAAVGDWLAAGANTLVSATSTGTGGILGIIWVFLLTIATLLATLLRTIWRGIKAILALIWRGLTGIASFFGSFLRRSAAVSAQASSAVVSAGVRSTSEAMARRAAREEARDEIDVVIKEDPLRIQNRRLSALVIVLGVVVVGAVLWATDPNRSQTNNSLTSGGDPSLLLPAATTDPDDNPDALAVALPTTIPTTTPIPDALLARGTIAFTVRERGQTDLWAVTVGSRNPVRITNNIADERDPEWNSDGTRLAYASRQDGNWELYIYDLASQQSERLTYDLSFQANPSWSPDNLWLVYEDYRGGNLDVYASLIDGTGEPQRITDNPAPDFSPAWSPINSGREIAFVSWRDGNQDIYVVNLNNREEINVTNSPLINEDHPAWSPDGRYLAYSASVQGIENVFVKDMQNLSASAQLISVGRTPSWSPDGNSIAYVVDSLGSTQSQIRAVTLEGGLPSQVAAVSYGATAPTWSTQLISPTFVNSGGLPIAADVLYTEDVTEYTTGERFRLQSLGNVQNDPALLSDRVNDSFNIMRTDVNEQSGVDFLGELDETFWALDRPVEPNVPRRNWHMTGRAIAIVRNKILGFPPPMEVVREDIGVDTYWRIYIRVDEASQSGQLGEPLRQMPWDFVSATQGDPEAYNQGGRLRREMPQGYYVDLTQIAADYDWQRVPAASDWRANTSTRNYWLFIKPEGLEWFEAMQEIYLEGQIANFAPSS